jgi:hypothetical protein
MDGDFTMTPPANTENELNYRKNTLFLGRLEKHLLPTGLDIDNLGLVILSFLLIFLELLLDRLSQFRNEALVKRSVFLEVLVAVVVHHFVLDGVEEFLLGVNRGMYRKNGLDERCADISPAENPLVLD